MYKTALWIKLNKNYNKTYWNIRFGFRTSCARVSQECADQNIKATQIHPLNLSLNIHKWNILQNFIYYFIFITFYFKFWNSLNIYCFPIAIFKSVFGKILKHIYAWRIHKLHVRSESLKWILVIIMKRHFFRFLKRY